MHVLCVNVVGILYACFVSTEYIFACRLVYVRCTVILNVVIPVYTTLFVILVFQVKLNAYVHVSRNLNIFSIHFISFSTYFLVTVLYNFVYFWFHHCVLIFEVQN